MFEKVDNLQGSITTFFKVEKKFHRIYYVITTSNILVSGSSAYKYSSLNKGAAPQLTCRTWGTASSNSINLEYP